MMRYAVKQIFGLALLWGAALVAAGTWRWPAVWGYVGLVGLGQLATGLLLARHRPELLVERSGAAGGSKGYDVPLAVVMAYTPVFMVIAAGLQLRSGASMATPWGWWALAAAVGLGSTSLTLWAMLSNPFFSPVVRIQSERGHAVAHAGPYRYVRHPGCAGAIAFALASPGLLGSTWALAIAALAVVNAVLRTALEDRVLQSELPGYAAFCGQVRYRLVPGVW